MSEKPSPGPESGSNRPPLSDELHEIANEVNLRYSQPLRNESLGPDGQPNPSQRQEDLNFLHSSIEAAGRNVSSALRSVGGDIVDPNTELRRRSAERSAQIDPLTGLGNRAALNRARETAEQDPGTRFLMIDGDNFGKVNKAPDLGYAVGDGVIRLAARALEEAAAEVGLRGRMFYLESPDRQIQGTEPEPAADEVGSMAYRPGGDEFVILGPQEKIAEISKRAEAIFNALLANGVPVKSGEDEVLVPVNAFTDRGIELGLSLAEGHTLAEADELMQQRKAARKSAQAQPPDTRPQT